MFLLFAATTPALGVNIDKTLHDYLHNPRLTPENLKIARDKAFKHYDIIMAYQARHKLNNNYLLSSKRYCIFDNIINNGLINHTSNMLQDFFYRALEDEDLEMIDRMKKNPLWRILVCPNKISKPSTDFYITKSPGPTPFLMGPYGPCRRKKALEITKNLEQCIKETPGTCNHQLRLFCALYNVVNPNKPIVNEKLRNEAIRSDNLFNLLCPQLWLIDDENYPVTRNEIGFQINELHDEIRNTWRDELIQRIRTYRKDKLEEHFKKETPVNKIWDKTILDK